MNLALGPSLGSQAVSADSMSREIRVNPQELRASAQRLSALVAGLSLQRDQLLESAAGAPSYDGQFGPTVNALAAEGASQVHSTFTRLGELARQLEAIAELFETADAETLQAIEGMRIQIGAEIAGFMTLLARLSPPGAPPSQVRLDLTLEEFRAMSAAERIAWVEAFNRGAGDDWFSNFEDILYYFNDSKIFTGLDGSTPASLWMSWGDAAVLQVVQDGYALFLDPEVPLPGLPEGTPAGVANQRMATARLWAAFFDAKQSDYSDLSAARELWGAAEQAGVDYGEDLADFRLEQELVQLSPVEAEAIEVFVGFGDAYRTTIAHDAGQAVFEAAPGAIAGQVGERVAQDFQASLQADIRQRLAPVGALFELFTGQPGSLLVDQVSTTVFEENTPFGLVDDVGQSIGEWAGDRVAGTLEPELGEMGESFFDPRLRWAISVEVSDATEKADVEIGLRGPLYHLSMTVENMLLTGDGETARAFLASVQASVEKAIGQPPN